MKKLIGESWLVVTMALVFACLLAGAQTVFLPKIKVNEDRALSEAITEVVPDLDPDSEPEKLEIERQEVYKCLRTDGTVAGWAVVAEGGGFIDKIKLVAGLSADGGEILGIKVIEHKETPGLGNKIDTKGKENAYPLQYQGKRTGKALELVKKGGGSQPYHIEAITGATYSSQYTMDIVNDVIKRIVPKLPAE